MTGDELDGWKWMRDLRIAEDQGVAWKRPGRTGANHRKPFQTHVPFRPGKQFEDKHQAAVGVFGLRARLFHFDDQAAPEGPVAIGAPELARTRAPDGLEIAAPDQAVGPHVEDVGEV